MKRRDPPTINEVRRSWKDEGFMRRRIHQRRVSEKRVIAEFLIGEPDMYPMKLAKKLNISRTTATRWTDLFKINKTTKSQTARGRRRTITDEQKKQLTEILKDAPSSHGANGNRWTLKSISELIQSRFGITVHQSTIKRLLNDVPWFGKINKTKPHGCRGSWREQLEEYYGKRVKIKKIDPVRSTPN